MRSRTRELKSLIAAVVFIGCGGAKGDVHHFGDWSDVGQTQSHDWVVDGMECEGKERTRLVGTVDGELRFRRGDECVDRGELFWTEPPRTEGDQVSILVNSEPDSYEERRISVEDSSRYVLHGEGEEPPWVMRKVYEEVSPTSQPDLTDFDLAGQWWMEGYPCFEHEPVPQLVRIIDPPGAPVYMNKVVGDGCVSDGEAFVDAEVSGTSISGVPRLHDDWEFGQLSDDGGDDMVGELSGRVRREHYIRLDVLGELVHLRRVLADPQ